MKIKLLRQLGLSVEKIRQLQQGSVFHLCPLSDEPFNLACSILLAQEECGFWELLEFQRLYQAHWNDKMATIEYQNILVYWNITSDLGLKEGVLSAGGEDNVKAELEFTVTIKQKRPPGKQM